MAKGPQLTQRKIDKLRDALHVIRECTEVQLSSEAIASIDLTLIVLGKLENAWKTGKAALNIHHELGREKEA